MASVAFVPQLPGLGDILLGGTPVPWTELIPASSGPVARDLLDDVRDVGVEFVAIEVGGLDDGIDSGCACAAGLLFNEVPVLSADHYGPDRVFCTVIVDLGSALADAARERIPALAAIAE